MPRLDTIRQMVDGHGSAQETQTLTKGNERLRKAVSNLTLDKLIPSEVAKGSF
jgi:hypothetical protein